MIHHPCPQPVPRSSGSYFSRYPLLLESAFIRACERGDVQSIHDFLKFKSEAQWPWSLLVAEGLNKACQHGRLKAVEFLMTQEPWVQWTLPEGHPDLNDSPLETACFNSQINVVKYLISSPNLAKNPSMQDRQSKAFLDALKATEGADKTALLSWLILEGHVCPHHPQTAFIRTIYPQYESIWTALDEHQTLSEGLGLQPRKEAPLWHKPKRL